MVKLRDTSIKKQSNVGSIPALSRKRYVDDVVKSIVKKDLKRQFLKFKLMQSDGVY